jgi:hypothetical protein
MILIPVLLETAGHAPYDACEKKPAWVSSLSLVEIMKKVLI